MVSFVLVLWLTPGSAGCCRAGVNPLFPTDIWKKKKNVAESAKCSKYKKWRDANE